MDSQTTSLKVSCANLPVSRPQTLPLLSLSDPKQQPGAQLTTKPIDELRTVNTLGPKLMRARGQIQGWQSPISNTNPVTGHLVAP